MKLILEKNALRLTVDGAARRLTGGGERQLVWYTQAEYAVQVRTADGERLIDSRCAAPEPVAPEPSADGTAVRFVHDVLEAEVAWAMGAEERAVYKTVTLTARVPLTVTFAQTEIAVAHEPLTRGGEGQPLFIGESGYIAAMFPTAVASADGERFVLRQAPFAALAAGERLTLPTVVYGLSGEDGTGAAFLTMLRRHRPHPGEPLSVYCDWGAHDELADEPEPPHLDEAMADRLLDDLLRAREKTGLRFDYYLADDRWYDPDEPYTAFAPVLWPRGGRRFAERVERAGMRFGAWFDVNMQRVATDAALPRRYGQQKELCMADPRNAALLFSALAQHIRDTGVRLLKFDFAFFSCGDPTHETHAHGGALGKDAAVRRFADGVRRLRTLCPELRVLLYNGFTTDLDWIGSVDRTRQGFAVSPFWSMIGDYIYCGDPRPSEWPMPRELSLIHYSDCMLAQFTDALMPRDAVDDHGTMVGVTNTIYYLGRRCLRDGYVMNIARGTRKRHLYGETALLDEDDWRFLADAEEMFSFVCRPDCRTEAVLQPPAIHTVYGYASVCGGEGYVTAVNVTDEARPVEVRLPAWQPGDRLAFWQVYGQKTWQKTPLPEAAALCVTLPPYSVQVYRFAVLPPRERFGCLELEPGAAVRMAAEDGTLSLCRRRETLSPLRGSNTDPALQTAAHGCTAVRQETRAVWSGVSAFSYTVGGCTPDACVEVRDAVGKGCTVLWTAKKEAADG